MKDKYASIILAAGQSRRFGKNKLLSIFKGKTLLEHSLTPFLLHRNVIKDIYVVIGPQKTDFLAILKKYPVKPVENTEYEKYGMSLSIKLGLKNLIGENIENLVGVFIHPGDIPLINLDILSEFFRYPKDKKSLILIPVFKNKRGHPLFIGKNLLKKIDSISDESQGLKGFLQENNDRIEYLDINSDIILYDIDNVEDLSKFDNLNTDQ
ncbi:MAG: putative molybdenum cofactor guanylyltransferase [Candidatus Heimdallarchaeota archaeon LC_3]|nr:MAG: putative molybdenum cofactor guanylyltransferase [Candidatus Heimdallarchaeota archaeon LC_3]